MAIAFGIAFLSSSCSDASTSAHSVSQDVGSIGGKEGQVQQGGILKIGALTASQRVVVEPGNSPEKAALLS